MRSTKFALSAGAAVAVVAALNIPLAPSPDLIAANQAGAALNCNLTEYKASTGLTSALEGNVLTVAWNGQGTSQLRARFAIDGGTPTIRDLSARRGSGEWGILGQNLTPEYQVTTGRRRMSNDQANAFASLGIDVTPEVLEKHKWYAFWDAPLSVPGYSPAREGGGGRGGAAQEQTLGQGGTMAEQVAALQSGSRGRPGYNPNPNPPGFTGGRGIPLPRTKEEIRRGVSAFSASSCEVKSDGASLAVTFPGMKLGIFDGNLRFTVYRGTNLIQMDAIARTNEPSVAYKYDAGLKGFSTATMPRVTWRDTGGHPQQHQFGGPKAIGLSAIRASNRLLLAEGPRGSVATFPPPHTFFFTREVDVNLGTSSIATTAAARTASASRCRKPSPIRSRSTSRTMRCTTPPRARGRRCRCTSTPARSLVKRRGRQRSRSHTKTSSSRSPATRRSSITSIYGSSTGCVWAGSTRRFRT